jgi:N-dimethylarginine dimethylaminohydrolase
VKFENHLCELSFLAEFAKRQQQNIHLENLAFDLNNRYFETPSVSEVRFTMEISKKVPEKFLKYFENTNVPSIPLPSNYMEDLEAIWGRKWGAQSEIGELEEVLLQHPGSEVAPPEEDLNWYQFRVKGDPKKLRDEHDQLVELLKGEGVRVHFIEPTREWLMKEPFGAQHPRMAGGTRDPGFVVNGGAIIGRMSLPYRRGEEYWWMRTVVSVGCPILYTVRGNGTFEGGNVVWLDPTHVCIGKSARTNQEGIDQVAKILGTLDPPVEEIRVVPIPGWLNNLEWPAGGFAHLDCVFGYVDDGLALVYPPGLPYDFIEYLRSKNVNMIEIPSSEAKDVPSNIVALGPGKIIMIAGFHQTQKMLEKEGVEVITIPFTEFAIHGGGPHCATGPMIRRPGPKL